MSDARRQELLNVIQGRTSFTSAGLIDPGANVPMAVMESVQYRPFVTNWSTVWGISSLRGKPGSKRGAAWEPSNCLRRIIDAQQKRASEQYSDLMEEDCDCDICEELNDDE